MEVKEYGPGDVAYIPPGHNTWVDGNEAYTGIEFASMENYAKR